MDRQESESLLQREIVVEGQRYKLTSLLGGGLTSEVYKGLNFSSSSEVAVKIARPRLSDNLSTRFKTEVDILRRLEEKSTQEEAYYFPKVVAFDKTCNIPDVGVRMVLIQELIGPGFIPLSDLKLDYEDLRLPEPLALTIGMHYLRALEIVHHAGYACRDRKLRDIRWKWGEGCEAGDFASWLRTDNPGELRILDWNVVGGPAEQPGDLLKFGEFWFELLLGSRLSMRLLHVKQDNGETKEQWWPIHRFEKQSGWDGISFGTQQLLNQLLHPEPCHYKTAGEVREHVERIRKIWGGPLQELLNKVQREESSLDLEAIGQSLERADVAYLACKRYGLADELPLGLEEKRDTLERSLRANTTGRLQDVQTDLKAQRFGRAISRIDKLPADDPWIRWQETYLRMLARFGSDAITGHYDEDFWEVFKKLVDLDLNETAFEDLESALSALRIQE